MADRQLYPEGVEILNTDLQKTEFERIYHTQQRHVDGWQSGRATGLVISPGVTSGNIQVSAGHGYTPRGDLVVLAANSADLVPIVVTDNAVNHVCLIYRETPTAARAHESDGTTPNTEVNVTSELVVFSDAQFTALANSTMTSPANVRTALDTDVIANNDRSRMCYVGKFLAAGASIVISGSEIYQEAVYTDVKAAEITGTPTLKSGFNVRAVSSDNPDGTGTLKCTIAGVAPSQTATFYWKAPGDGSYGTGSSAFSLRDADSYIAEFELSSSTVARKLKLEVFPAVLPFLNGDYTSDFAVTTLHVDTGALASVIDKPHRMSKGVYAPSPSNPHGSALIGSENQLVALIGKMLHLGKDALANTTDALQPRAVVPRFDAGGANDRTLLWESPSAAASDTATIRVYGLGRSTSYPSGLEVTINARWNLADSNWYKDTSSTVSSTKLALDRTYLRWFTQTAATSSFIDSAFIETALVDGNSAVSTLGVLRLADGFATATADWLKPRLQTKFSGDEKYTLIHEFVSGGGPLISVRLYAQGSQIIAGESSMLVIVSNAEWNGSVWTKDVVGKAATKYLFGNNSLYVQHREAATAGTWNDAGWSYDQVWTDGATSAMYNRGTLYGAAGNTTKTLQAFGREVSGNLAPVSPQERWLVSEDGIESSSDGARKYKIRRYIRFLNSEIREETTMNARWDGTVWNRDDGAATHAYIFIKSTDGRERIFRRESASPASPSWSDTVSAGNWTSVSFDSNRTARACGYITLANNGTSVATAQNATAVPSGSDIVVTFDYPMPSASYGVLVHFNPSSAPTNNKWPLVPRVVSRLTTGFTISAHKGDLGSNTVTQVNLANESDSIGTLDFAVFGDGIL